LRKLILNRLWLGWKVIDDVRCKHYIFLSPCGAHVWTVGRQRVDLLRQEGLIYAVVFVGRREKDQPGLSLTPAGLEAIGKPTAGNDGVELVSGPDIRRRKHA
jgi:hypothetical protein